MSTEEEDFEKFLATEDDLKKILGETSKKDKELVQALGQNPVIVEERVPMKAPKGDVLSDDLEHARDNVYESLSRAQDALYNLSQIAERSQHPRAFEVMSMLAKTIVEGSETLIRLHERSARAESNQPATQNVKYQQNNILVGTTAEIQKILRDAQELEDNGND